MRTDYITNGDLFGFVAAAYTDVLGAWAYLIVFAIFLIMMFLKTQGFEMPFLMAFIIAAALGFVLPVGLGSWFLLLFAIASAVIALRVFKS